MKQSTVYESEVYKNLIAEVLPQAIQARFSETLNSVRLRSTLSWSEHCTECAIPTCYQLCELYVPRMDGKCQRFTRGMEAFYSGDLPTQLLKISFRKWASLGSQASEHLVPKEESSRSEKRDLLTARFIHMVPGRLKGIFIQKRYARKKNEIIQSQQESDVKPDAFLLECHNPGSAELPLTLVFRSQDEKYRNFPFEHTIKLAPGYNKEIIPYDEIAKRIKPGSRYWISIQPIQIPEDQPLYFGLMEFVSFNKIASAPVKIDKLKCVVWDLDNTLWEGTLIEDGLEKLRLKEGIKSTLEELESQGIVNSIASKNNPELATAALEHLRLSSFFVFPKISWNPKNQALKEIARDLNIGINSLAFVDDSPFERDEIKHFFPGMQVVDPADVSQLLNTQDSLQNITAEGKTRKEFYVDEQARKQTESQFGGDYLDFLRSCSIKLIIERLSAHLVDRIYELTRRTNQLNFSGVLYEKADIIKLADNPDLEAFALSCSDKFGDYGIIGFALIDKQKNQLQDLTFSCRIQSKRIEHAFIAYCLTKYGVSTDFYVRYKHTDLNRFSAQVFWDYGFEVVEKNDDVYRMVFRSSQPIPDDGIVTIIPPEQSPK